MIALKLTENQALAIADACEIVARLGIGQFRDALRLLPLNDATPDGWHDDMDVIGKILKKHTIDSVDGWNSSLGIHSEKLKPSTKVNWEIHKAIRHKLAWDRAKAHGLTDGTTRDWKTMNSIDFDEPTSLTDEGLPETLDVHSIVAGAIFDLMGSLTTLEEPVTFGSAHDASIAVEMIQDFAEKRGLIVDTPDVENWQDKLRD